MTPMDNSNTLEVPNDDQETISEPRDITDNRETRDFIQREVRKVRTRPLRIGMFGAAGVGKSNLCDALFARKVDEVRYAVHSHGFRQTPAASNNSLTLVDMLIPKEKPDQHQKYIELCQSLVPGLDLIIWAIKGDDDAYASTARIYEAAIKPHENACPVILVVTQADRIEPRHQWDEQRQRPSKQQKHNQEVRRWEISQQFDIRAARLIAVSTVKNYNIDLLIDTMISVLPNGKKASLVREARQENISDEMLAASETGILDHLCEKVGDGVYHAREFLMDFVTSAASRYNSRVSRSIVSRISEKNR